MGVPSAVRFAAVAAALACGEAERSEPMAGPAERLTSELRFTMLDRSAAFTVQDSGLVQGLSYVLHDAAVVLWPGGAPARGAPIVLGRLGQTEWGGPVEAFWQPLVIRTSRDGSDAVALGVFSLVGTGQDGRVRTQIGRYLMAWQSDSVTPRLRAILVAGMPLPALGAPELVAIGPRPTPALPPVLAEADSALRVAVADRGAGDGFAAHIAEDGVMFGDNGELLIGPEAVRTALLPAARARTRMTFEDGGLSADGSVGWTQGTAVVFRSPPRVGEPPITDTLSYLVLWQGGPDGALQVLSAGLVSW